MLLRYTDGFTRYTFKLYTAQRLAQVRLHWKVLLRLPVG